MARKTGETNEQNNDNIKKELSKTNKKPAKPKKEINKPKRIKKVKPVTKDTKKVIKEKQKKINRNKPLSTKTKMADINKKYITHTGEKLSALQGKFVNLYIELGNQRQAVIQAGYRIKNPDTQANQLLRIPKIADEINFRLDELKKNSIAKADEILQYYTKVMRGEEKDQFGLEAPLSERTKAASELAKRLIDIPNKMEANITKAANGQASITLALDWSGMEETNDETNTDQSTDTDQ